MSPKHGYFDRERIRYGALIGSVMAAIYSMVVLALVLGAGRRALVDAGIHPVAVILAYFAAGSIGGALAGALSPLGRSVLGSMVLGTFIAIFAVGAIMLAVFPPGTWNEAHWLTWGLCTVIFGVMLGPISRRLF